MANPRPVVWGRSPILVQATTNAGIIKVTVSVLFEGEQMPISGELVLESKALSIPLVFKSSDLKERISDKELKKQVVKLQSELNALKLNEVERHQENFGEKTNE